MAAKQRVDWDAVEPEYRAGIKSLRQLAEEFGCSSGRIAQAAKERGWERDLTEKIKAKAKSKLNKVILSSEAKQDRPYSESELIDANSDRIVAVQLTHRSDIGRARKLAMSLLDELEEATDNKELFRQLGVLLHAPDEQGRDKLNEIYMKVVSLPGRSTVMKQLGETLKIVVGLEREAFGLESKNPLGDLSDAVKNMTISFVSAQKPQS